MAWVDPRPDTLIEKGKDLSTFNALLPRQPVHRDVGDL